MALDVIDVVSSAGSWNQTPGSSLRHSVESTAPSLIGTSTELPVRLSVIVIDSATWTFLPLRRAHPEKELTNLSDPRQRGRLSWARWESSSRFESSTSK